MIGSILKKYVGYVVVINAIDPSKMESCGLKGIDDDYFSVVTQKDLLIHIPYSRILSIIEGNDGASVKIPSGFKKVAFQVIIQIEYMIIYKGSTSYGLQVPV
jgi:hypothetical protein